MGPTVLSLYTTDRCNMRCTYCFTTEQRREHSHTDMSVEVAKRVFALYPQAQTVRFGAPGEPLMLDELPQLVFLASRRVRRVVVATNGVRVRDSEIPWGRVAQVNVSVTDSDPERFKEITGVDRLDEVCRGIEHLVGQGVSVVNSYVAHRGNMHRLHEFVKLSASQGARRVVLQPYFGVPGWTESLLAGGDEVEQVLREQMALCRGLKVRVRWPPLIKLDKPEARCDMSNIYLAVDGDGDGDVALCCRGPGPRPAMGNIAQGCEVWSTGPMARLRARVNGPPVRRPQKCQLCWVNYQNKRLKP